MRLIDADALKAKIRADLKKMKEKGIRIYDTRGGGVSLELLKMIAGYINNQPTVQPFTWKPCESKPPKTDEDGYSEKVLVCFFNFNGVDIAEYRVNDGEGKWYPGDEEKSYSEYGLFVDSWRPLPTPRVNVGESGKTPPARIGALKAKEAIEVLEHYLEGVEEQEAWLAESCSNQDYIRANAKEQTALTMAIWALEREMENE